MFIDTVKTMMGGECLGDCVGKIMGTVGIEAWAAISRVDVSLAGPDSGIACY